MAASNQAGDVLARVAATIERRRHADKLDPKTRVEQEGPKHAAAGYDQAAEQEAVRHEAERK